MNQIIIGTFGHPGSGKSYFSERLAKDLHLAHLRSDDIRFKIVSPATFTKEEHAKVFGLMDFLAEKFLSAGVGVVYDANLTTKTHRDRLKEIAEKTGSKFVLIHIETPLELAVERAKTRDFHQIDRSVVEAIHAESEHPGDELPVIIDGTKTYDEQRRKILDDLNAVLEK